MKQKKINRSALELISTDDFVPKDHLLKRIDRTIDFTQIYKLLEPVYCEDSGRAVIDPMILFKLLFLQRLYNLPTLQRALDDAAMNVAYRWFLGYTMSEKMPHFAALADSLTRRYTQESIEKTIAWMLEEANKAGFLDPSSVYLDATQDQTAFYLRKQIREQIPQAVKTYGQRLMDDIARERKARDKRRG